MQQARREWQANPCLLEVDGSVLCWGRNHVGQLGKGDSVGNGGTNSAEAVEVTGLTGNAIAIAAGFSHSCALLQDGSVMCWGRNTYGQLGTGDFVSPKPTAQAININALNSVTLLAVGGDNSCAIGTGANGSGLYCWGKNSASGQVGDNDPGNNKSLPVKINVGSNSVVEVVVGSNHSCVRLLDNSVQCWAMFTLYCR